MKKIIFCCALLLFCVPCHAQDDAIYVGTIRYDADTYAQLVESYEHFKIHTGDSYNVFYSNSTTNTGEQTCIGFNTPAAPDIHMVASGTATAAASFSIYRAPSIDNGEGTAISVWNREENSTNTSSVTSVTDPAVANKMTSFDETQAAGANITTTTEIWHEDIGQTGNPNTRSGGGSRDQFERVLKASTQYAVCLAADDNNDNVHNLHINFYEDEDE